MSPPLVVKERLNFMVDGLE
jgi:hypothetical protein